VKKRTITCGEKGIITKEKTRAEVGQAKDLKGGRMSVEKNKCCERRAGVFKGLGGLKKIHNGAGKKRGLV